MESSTPTGLSTGVAKIGAAVDVHQPYVMTCFDCRADDGNGQRAFSTNDDRDLTGSHDGRDLASGITQYLKRPNQVVRRRCWGCGLHRTTGRSP
jgi:hypothetical protein